MRKLVLAGIVLLAIGLYLNPPHHISVANADQVSQLRQQLARERQVHKLDRARIAQELKRLHKMVHKYQINFDKSGIDYHSPREAIWICIHEHEGAWNSNTGNGYFGGLQMDRGFMSTYGGEFLQQYGTANKWPWRTQIMVADRAYNGYGRYKGRGFGPWPNTRLRCGV